MKGCAMSDRQHERLSIKIEGWLEVSASGKLSVSIAAAAGFLFGIGRVSGWW